MAEVSVIVPVYQVEQYLRQCLDSILKQTFIDFELILVDDGSKDNSGKICDEYALKDNRVRVIHQVNKGLSDARNTGMNQMSGKYFMFVDSDDYISELMVEKLYEKAEETGADIVCCNFEYFWKNNEKASYSTKQRSEVLSSSEIFNHRKNERNYGFWTVAWNKLYRTKSMHSFQFRSGKIHEDEFWANDIYQKDLKVVTIEDSLYYYRQRHNSIIGVKNIKKEFDLIEAYQERIQIYLDQNVYPDQAYKVMIYSLEPLHECRKMKETEEENRKYIQAVKKTEDLIRQLKHTELSGVQKYSLILIQMNPCLVFSIAMKFRGILEKFI